MRYNRTKNATRNIVFSLTQRIYGIVVPFLIRTVFIHTLGPQYLGLDSLFISVLQMLNLTELGVGTAMVYSMYKPLAEDDIDTVCALMGLYKKYYRIIGLVVLVLGLAITPFIPFIVKDDLPSDINMYVLYFFNLASTVITYWLFAYKNCIIVANQRVDINVKISMCVNTFMYLAQIAVLLYTKNYYWYIGVKIFTSIISNLVTATVANRLYPQFKAKGVLPEKTVKAVNNRVKDLFTAKIGSVVIYSVDTIVISAFLGLTVLGKYQNYIFIMNAVIGCIGIVHSSMKSIIGNTIVIDSPQKNYDFFSIFLFGIVWISGVCTSCFLCLYQPFMELWAGKELMLDFGVAVCFSIYFFVFEINKVLNLYKDASGMWHSDRFRPLIISLLNLGLNLLTVNYFGLYGIILSTVVPMVFISYPWLTSNICHEIFEPKYNKEILCKLAVYFAATVAAAVITYGVCSLISLPLLPTLIVRGLVCAVLPNVIFLVMFFKTQDFKNTLGFINRKFLKGRVGFLEKIVK